MPKKNSGTCIDIIRLLMHVRYFGTFNCSWKQLFWTFLQLAVCFIYKCTVSVLVRSLHMKEKSLHKPLAKLMRLNLFTLIEGTYSIICTYYTCPVCVWSKIVFGLKILVFVFLCLRLWKMDLRQRKIQNTLVCKFSNQRKILTVRYILLFKN